MTMPLPGISGSLLPGRFLVDGLDAPLAAGEGRAPRARLRAWWTRVSTTCGPASGVRLLFDVGAMPLFALLGYRAREVRILRDEVRASLETPSGVTLALVVHPWARRPGTGVRAVADAAREARAGWTFVVSLPFLSLVDVRGHAVRRSIEFELPDALDERSVDRFWLLCRAMSFDAGRPGAIDRILADAARFQDRVRSDLQHGVLDALRALGPIASRAGHGRGGFDQALTLIYRMLFLLFAESRDLVPGRHPVYGAAYSIATLCREALPANGAPRGLWDGLAAITRLSRTGCRTDDLIVRPFNGRLFARSAAPILELPARTRRGAPDARRRDAALARALVAVGTRPGRAGREEIAYADLGVEQLGAVYERVLDFDAGEVVSAAADDTLSARGGAGRQTSLSIRSRRPHSVQRKQTGTFYTPRALAEFVVRRTLAPLVHGASSDAILELRVIDPAMGSGAFLVAACRYLTSAYERALVDEGRSAETDFDDGVRADHRRLIAERCLWGIDVNPVAVQLARLSLWLTTLSRGKPLGFLDHRLRTGNSLIGVSPEDLWRTGEARRPSPVRTLSLLDAAELGHAMRQVARPMREIARRPDDTVADVRSKEAAWTKLIDDASPIESWRLACSLWCARFFWPGGCRTPRPSDAELRASIDAIVRGDRTLGGAHLQRWIETARDIAARHGFFHWPLEFADAFYDEHGASRLDAGFDAVIGNPPWEMLRREPAALDGAATAADERSARLVSFIRRSGLYPSCVGGHVNLYQPFLDRALSMTRRGGRVGMVLPWGLSADDGAAELRRRLLDRSALDTLLGLDNAQGLFPIHRGLRFVVATATTGAHTSTIRARFGVKTAEEIEALPDIDEPGRESGFDLRLGADVVREIGGAGRRFLDLRRPSDLDWMRRLHRDFPAIGDARGWHLRFGRELNATEDRGSFGATGLPVIEGKNIVPFAVRLEGARQRISAETAARLLPDGRHRRARLGYRDVSGVGNRLSLIAAIVPPDVVTTHTIFCSRSALPLDQLHFLCALFNSYVLNAIVRMQMGTHVTTGIVEALPAPPWTRIAAQRRIVRMARRLAVRADDHRTHASLQAAVARLYGFDRAALASIVSTFPLVPAEERDAAVSALS